MLPAVLVSVPFDSSQCSNPFIYYIKFYWIKIRKELPLAPQMIQFLILSYGEIIVQLLRPLS